MKLDNRTKWSYCVGATGRDAAYALVSVFLITYIQYTMKLTTAQFAAISGIVVFCMIWDAINDPLMGLIVEKCNFKMGKYRPFILAGALLNAVVIVALFSVRPTGWKFVCFFGIAYLLWGMTFTMNDIAYWGMLPSLTSDSKERDMLVTLMSVFVCIGQFSVAGLLPTLVAGNAVTAYRIAAIVIASCFVAFQLLTVFGAKERPRVYNADKAMSLKDMFHTIFKNDQLVPIAVACFFFNVGYNLLMAIGMNFFYFEFGYQDGGSMVFWFTVMYGLGTLLSQICYPLFNKFLNRDRILKLMFILCAFGYISMLLFGYVIPRNVIFLNAVGFIIFFAQGMNNLCIVVMLNNTIEYAEYRYEERHESIISAARSFAVKLAGAVNQGVVAIILIVSGLYQVSQKVSGLEIEAGAGNLTSEEVLTKAEEYIQSATSVQLLVLRIGIVLIPAVTFITCYTIIQKKYHIDEAKYDEYVEAIMKRRGEKKIG